MKSKRSDSSSSPEGLALASVLVGLLLLGLSMYWTASSDQPPLTYSDEEAAAYLDEAAKLHDMAFQTRPSGNSKTPLVTPEQLEVQRKKYEEQKSAVESARSRTQITRWVLMGAGLVFTMGGLFMYKIISE